MSDEFAVRAVELARARQQTRRENACQLTAAWIVETAWMLHEEHFEDELLRRPYLVEVDRQTFREFRVDVLEGRAA